MTIPTPRRRVAAVLAVVASLLLPATATLDAQSRGRVNLFAGATFSELRGLDDVDTERRTATAGGLGLLVPFSERIALRPELWFTSRGADAPDDDGRVVLSYVDLPVLLQLSLGGDAPVSPHLYVGPSLGYQISCDVTVGSVLADCEAVDEVSTKTVEVAGIVGGGLDIALGRLVLTGGVRYQFGVSTVAEFAFDDVRERAKSGHYLVYVGLGFALGR